jgi:hypothetical protein
MAMFYSYSNVFNFEWKCSSVESAGMQEALALILPKDFSFQL